VSEPAPTRRRAAGVGGGGGISTPSSAGRRAPWVGAGVTRRAPVRGAARRQGHQVAATQHEVTRLAGQANQNAGRAYFHVRRSDVHNESVRRYYTPRSGGLPPETPERQDAGNHGEQQEHCLLAGDDPKSMSAFAVAQADIVNICDEQIIVAAHQQQELAPE
jgi:hypothetical protein